MTSGTTDKIEGKLHEAKGKLKETVGHVTNNPALEAEGQDEHTSGKIQKKVGQIKEVLEK
jgi:uncharacterized protein YjbJ (UPF0337 family)